MNAEPLVSVIVPVYNVEAYLEECVDSIIHQTYRNIEIILVDDGSTDRSGAVCEELSSKDSRIRVIHKDNGGLSEARNIGLAYSKGKWVSFIDADDWVSPVFIEALYSAAVSLKCDMAAVPFGVQFRDGDSCKVVRLMGELSGPKAMSVQEALTRLFYQDMETGAQWRICRREVLGENPFPVGLYYEDLASVYAIVSRSNSVALLNDRNLYAYRIRQDGITRQEYKPIKAASILTITERLYLDISDWYPELKDAAASRCFSACRMVFAQLLAGEQSNPEITRDREALWGALVRYREVVARDPHARKRERLAASIACLGEGPFAIFCQVARKLGLLR